MAKPTKKTKSQPRQIILSYQNEGWQAEFMVDLQKAYEPCRESLLFFYSEEQMPAYVCDDLSDPATVITAFLKFWAPYITFWSAKFCGSEEGIIRQTGDWEGLFPLDGSRGINLINCDRFELDRDNFDVTPF